MTTMNEAIVCRHIDADKLIEDFKVSGRFDYSELDEIIKIIEDQPSVVETRNI